MAGAVAGPGGPVRPGGAVRSGRAELLQLGGQLRALRRRQRANRLRGPLNRDQMALPLVAGCLLLALITSTLLIMFAADQTGVPLAPRPSVTQAPAKSKPTPGQIGGPLPASAVVIGQQTVALSKITAKKPAAGPAAGGPGPRPGRSGAPTANYI